MKILIDMNLSLLWVEFLGARGIGAVHWSSVGSAAAPDGEILDYAARNELTVFTHDLAFGNLLAHRSARGPGVVQVRAQAVLPTDVGETAVTALRMSEAQPESGALLTVDPDRSRIRLVPIR